MIKLINFLIVSVTIISFAGCVTTHSHDHSEHKKLKFGAPSEGMSKEEYQSLVFLDPQNTIRADYHAVKGLDFSRKRRLRSLVLEEHPCGAPGPEGRAGGFPGPERCPPDQNSKIENFIF